MIKKRKKRGMKLSGRPSLDMCNCCFSVNCDTFLHGDSIYIKKVNQRLKNKVCVGCGKNPCECKSGLHIQYN